MKPSHLMVILSFPMLLMAQHHPGLDCFTCHVNLRVGGTIYADSTGTIPAPGIPASFIRSDGATLTLDDSDRHGNIHSTTLEEGSYLIKLGRLTSRTWHAMPSQRSCNRCHIPGGNGGVERVKMFPNAHTAIPADNTCTHCHHFPVSMSLTQLRTPGVLYPARPQIVDPGSQVRIGAKTFSVDPSQYSISTTRPDIFAPGFYSMFDVILAVARRNSISIEYHFDDSCQTHLITSVNNVAGEYWYHFSYDAGSGNTTEMQNRRANRWDEALWRPGVWIQLIAGEDVAGLRRAFKDEIIREKAMGHLIPMVQFTINPQNYKGNPPGSNRITVSRTFNDVAVTAHNVRSTGYPTPYSKPFQPGVVTSMDIPLSLMDQGKLTAVTGVFYDHFARNYIDSYYVVELGFPGVGTAHSSGRQGFVYLTENGSPSALPNRADNKLHMTCDINVIHAPAFSLWRWIELGNPYYESTDPSGATGLIDPLIEEDYDAVGRGFNLHPPAPNPLREKLKIRYNMFQPLGIRISIHDLSGREVALLREVEESNVGIHEIEWSPRHLPSGSYLIIMRAGNNCQERRVVYFR